MKNLNYLDDYSLKDLGKRIQDLRMSRNLTQEWLAELLNVTPQKISNIERGIVRPSYLDLYKITIIFKVSTTFLITGERKKN